MSLSFPAQPVHIPKMRKKPRKKRFFAPPRRSARLYVYINPSKVHLFRYFLESQENLGIMTVVDRWRAALLIRFSPDQEKELRDWLEGMKESISFSGPFSFPVS